MIECTCKWRGCREKFMARKADVDRGWAKFCSKSCKAKEQESRTGQFASHGQKSSRSPEDQRAHEIAMDSIEDGWDGHKNSF